MQQSFSDTVEAATLLWRASQRNGSNGSEETEQKPGGDGEEESEGVGGDVSSRDWPVE